jgi:microcompartment protein CcmK/EutM
MLGWKLLVVLEIKKKKRNQEERRSVACDGVQFSLRDKVSGSRILQARDSEASTFSRRIAVKMVRLRI